MNEDQEIEWQRGCLCMFSTGETPKSIQMRPVEKETGNTFVRYIFTERERERERESRNMLYINAVLLDLFTFTKKRIWYLVGMITYAVHIITIPLQPSNTFSLGPR